MSAGSGGDPRMAGLPPGVAARLKAGARALRDRNPAHAERAFSEAVRQSPAHPEPLRYLAILQLHTRRAALAAQTLRQALALAPDDARLHSDLGNALSACGDAEAALASWRDACRRDPGDATAWFNLGRNLQLRGETDAAIEALTQAAHLSAGLLPAHVLLGDALVHAGRLDEAVARYRAALALQPACGDAWRGLSNIKSRALGDDDARQLEAQLRRPDVAPSDKVAMGHAQGKREEDRGRPDEAYAAFGAANGLQQRLTPWSRQAFERFVDQALEATSALPAPADPVLGAEAIFIVGQPRSGSTLVGQVLAAHPQVEGAGELPDLGIVLQQESLRRGVPYPQWVPQASAGDWQRLGREYLQRTRRWRNARPRSADKLPENWKHVGVLRAMLPGAIVMETRRDPLETAWSCFKQQFYSQPHFANSFEGIAAHIAGAIRAMDAFRARDPAPIHLHAHEDLLADPEARIRRLLADCGLHFDPACLSPHAVARNVRTASAAQVRQPLARATSTAAAYGSLLDPLRAALAAQGLA